MANDKTQDFGDERLKKSAATSVRGDRAEADAERLDKDGTIYSSEERRRMLRSEAMNTVLPNPPEIPGFHLCWLSTTNSTDPIYKRQRLGYVPVTPAEVKGFESYAVSGGQYDGCVMCNEMILFKIPNEAYLDIMSLYHHDMPMEEESMLREKVQQGMDEEDRDGNRLGSVDGAFNHLGQSKRPQFTL